MDLIDDEDLELQYADDFDALRDIEDAEDQGSVQPPGPSSSLGRVIDSVDIFDSQCNKEAETLNSEGGTGAVTQKDNQIQSSANKNARKRARLLSDSEPLLSDAETPHYDTTEAISGLSSNIADTKTECQPLSTPSAPLPKKRLKFEDSEAGSSAGDSKVERWLSDCSSETAATPQISFESLVTRSTRPISRWRSQKVTNSEGNHVYLGLRDEEEAELGVSCAWKQQGGLLGVPFSLLKEQVMAECLKRTPATDDSLHLSENFDATPRGMESETMLWVEKYKPHRYLELLSDEGVNRTLLQWLKLWDKVVFGRERKQRTKQTNNKPFQKKQNNFNKYTLEFDQELDAQNRPQLKVALLSGSPGLGKTTLAHVIAHHAGYNVVEMNASDDRSPEIFRTRLEAATQMKAVLGADPRPNCLIIDEIDGAPAASVNLLVSMMKSTGPVKGKRKKGDLPLILRPVICICNDLYVPALKPLRQIALVLNFPPTMPSRLVVRLQEITKQQKMQASLSVLLSLCEKAGNDIRSCLSTLQFLYSLKNNVSLSDIRSLSVGQKDSQKSLFSIWLEIFHLPKKKRQYDQPLPSIRERDELSDHQDLDPRNFLSRFSRVLHSVECSGDYEKLMSGLFENYLTISSKDSHMKVVCAGGEWLAFFDIIQQEIMHTQLYTLFPYMAYPAVAIHMLFAALNPRKINYPYSQTEVRNKRSQLESIAISMMGDMSPHLRCFSNMSSIVLDVLPALLYIIQPPVRPVNIQLFSEQERQQLMNVIQIMINYNLNYRQERSMEGTYHYVLEPNVEQLIMFTGTKPILTLTYATKQLIARELEVERMRRNEPELEKPKAAKTGGPLAKREKKDEPAEPAKTTVVPEKPAVDFFGREIKKTSPETKLTEGGKKKVKEVWFRFKEGYTNAVRKTVRIADFL